MVDDHTDSDALMLQALKSPVADQARAIRLMTPQAEVACRFYTLPGTLHGAMWVGVRGAAGI
jgi:hypothetical protein